MSRLRGWLVAASLLLPLGAAQAEDAQQCTGDLNKLLEEVQARQAQIRQSCEPVINQMQALLGAKAAYNQSLFDAIEFWDRSRVRVFEDDLSPLNDLVEIHNRIAVEAAAGNVLLDKATAQLVTDVRSGARNNGRVMFGVPIEAMSFDATEIALINRIRTKYNQNYLKMEDFVRAYVPSASEAARDVNKQLEGHRTRISDRFRAHQQLLDKFRQVFLNGKFSHCLGEPDTEGDVAVSVVQPGGPFGLNQQFQGFGEVQKEAQGVKFSSLPGISPPVTPLADGLSVLQDFPDPVPAPELPEDLAFKRDGRTISKSFIEAQLIQAEADRQLAFANFLDSTVGNVLRAPGYTVELGKKLVGGAVMSVYEPFARNLTDKSQSLLGAIARSGFEVTRDTVSGIVESGANLMGDVLDVISPGGLLVQRPTEELNQSARENNLFRAALQSGTSYFGELRNSFLVPPFLRGDGGVPLLPPPDNASPAQIQAFLDQAEARKEAVKASEDERKKRQESLKVLEQRAFDVLNVVSARGSFSTTIKNTGTAVRSVKNFVNDVRTNVKVGKALDDIETIRNTNPRLSPEAKAQIDGLRNEIRELQTARQPDGAIREVIEAAKQKAKDAADNGGAAVLDDAAARIREKRDAGATAKRPFNQKEVAKQGDIEIPVGEQVGKGGVKQVLDSPDPNAVLQKFNKRSDQDVLLARDIESGKRLEQAGIKTTKDVPFKDKDGNDLIDPTTGEKIVHIVDQNGQIIKQSERLDGNLEAAVIAKNNPDGRLTQEQFAAAAEGANKANDAGFILTDFKPENIALVADDAGRLEINAFDRDGVVSVDQVIANRQANPGLVRDGETASVINAFGEKIDLSTPAGRKQLQSLFIDGPEVCCPNISADTAKTLKSSNARIRGIVFADLLRQLSTPDFQAVGTGVGRFSDVAPLVDGKPTVFNSLDADAAARILDEGRDVRLLDELGDSPQVRGDPSLADKAQTLIDASKIIRGEADKVDSLVGKLEDIVNNPELGINLAGAKKAVKKGKGKGAGGGGEQVQNQSETVGDDVLLDEDGNIVEETPEQRRERLAEEAGKRAEQAELARKALRVVTRTATALQNEDGEVDDGFPGGK